MRLRRMILLILLLVGIPMAAAVGSRMTRHPNRFAIVEPNKLYRGGYPSADHIDYLEQDYSLNTIVNLTDSERDSRGFEEKEAAAQNHIKILRFPMPGNGVAEFSILNAAADAISDEKNQPVFWHCAAGKQRSNAVQAAYRMKHDKWPLERALKELEDQHDLDRVAEKTLCDHLALFEKWLTTRSPQSIERTD